MNKIVGIVTIVIIALSCGCTKISENILKEAVNTSVYNDIETISCRYDTATEFSNGRAIVKEGDNYKIIDEAGNIIIDMSEYDSVSSFSEGLVAVNKNEKWGYINKEGEEVIPCVYDSVGFFSDGLADVKKNGKWGYINKEGEEVIPCTYTNSFVHSFEDGVVRIEKNKKWGCVDKSGKEIIPCTYDYINPFSEGLAVVEKNMEVQEYDPYEETYNSTQKSQYGYINLLGEEVIPCSYDYAWEFSEGLAWVRKGNKLGCIDATGKEVIPCVYQSRLGIVPVFSEGLSLAAKNGKIGYVDKNGNEIVGFIYDGASDFSDGLARVKKNGKWGFIDRTGKEIISCVYEEEVKEAMDIVRDSINGKNQSVTEAQTGYYFRKGICTLIKNGKYGYIDKTGKEIIPCIYDDVAGCHEGFVRVKRNGKWGYIKLDENIIK